MAGESPDPSPGARLSMVGAVERLLAAAAVLGAALYVLVNGLYIEFYDDFGVRPEQVGFDRLAVLARSAWVALIAIGLVGPLIALASMRTRRRAWRQYETARRELEAALDTGPSRADSDADDASGTSGALVGRAVSNTLFERMQQAEDEVRSSFATSWVAAAVLTASLFLLAGFVLLAWRVDAEAERVSQGHSSNGIGALVPLVDVRANRADVEWLGPEEAEPEGLVDPGHLAYLGSGNGVSVFLECGQTTHVVNSADVAIRLLDQGEQPADVALSSDQEDAAETEAFEEGCAD